MAYLSKWSLRKFLTLAQKLFGIAARKGARRAPFWCLERNVPFFLRSHLAHKFECAWCPHYNLKFFQQILPVNAVILMGMSSSYTSSNNFCVNLKFSFFCKILQVLVSFIVDLAREKNGDFEAFWGRNECGIAPQTNTMDFKTCWEGLKKLKIFIL